MGYRTSLILWLCVGLCLLASGANAQTISNPSFEYGLGGWTAYTYVPDANTNPVEPTAGCVGPGCAFDLLDPGTPPAGDYACGIQSAATNGNGGIYQSFYWSGGATTLSVTARNYSETALGVPDDNGCLVRMGVVSDYSSNREDVTSWVSFPWSSSWTTQQLNIPGPGTYTVFVEAYQPDTTHNVSTLWDHVRLGEPVLITGGPSVMPDPSAPETAAIVTWTTDAPSTSQVDFGATTSYGFSASGTALTTSHSVTITGLTRTSKYQYRVKSTSGDYSCQSPNDVFYTPIQLIDLNVSLNEDNTVAYISWVTNVPTDAQVEFWPEVGPHEIVTEQAPMSTEHQVVLNLIRGKEYRFIATSHGAAPYTSVSTSGKFYTLPPLSASLLNGGFEDTDGYGQHTLYPWVQYTTDVGVTSVQAIDGLVGPYLYDGIAKWSADIRAYNGSYFLGTQANWGHKNGGTFQRVLVTPGQYYVLSARFITYRWGGENGYNTVRLGVDPNGGIDRNSPNVQWWSGYSETNNSDWHTASMTVVAGASGVATVFVDFRQIYSLEWHVAAVDGVSLYQPAPVSIGDLKASQWNLGAILENKIVTYVHPTPVWCGVTQYVKTYVQEDNRSSGIGVLFQTSASNLPKAGDRLTVTGALGEYNREACLLAEAWSVDQGPIDPGSGLPTGYTLPQPLGLSQKMLGTKVLNQPPMFSNNTSLCTVGLRARLFGRVTWVSSEGSPEDVIAYIDDGAKILDGSGHHGVRAYLPGKGGGGIHVGDYVAATGVLGIDFINPDHWPDPTDFYAFGLFVNASDDWTIVAGS